MIYLQQLCLLANGGQIATVMLLYMENMVIAAQDINTSGELYALLLHV